MRRLERILRLYIDKGWYLFPVNPINKKPHIKNMLEDASNEPEQLLKWHKKWPKCNWAVSLAKSSLVAVDVDTRHGGMEAWKGYLNDKDEPNTLIQSTGTGGLHYIFQANQSNKYRGKIQKGIDIKYNGYVVVYPSTNKNTGIQYEWRNWKTAKISSPPDWIDNLIIKTDLKGKSDPTFKFGNKYLEKLVKILKEEELDYEEWVQAGMALHSAEPNEEGLRLYLLLTEGVSYKEGDLDTAKEKWKSFSKTNDGITTTSLTFLIRKKGKSIPNPSYEEDMKAFKEVKNQKIKKAQQNEGFYKKNGRMICWKRDEIVSSFNKMGFAYLESGGNAPYLRVKKDENFIKVKTMTEKALAEYMAPYFFAQKKESFEDVKVIFTPAHKEWRESIDRNQYRNIVFQEHDNGKDLNLYTPLKMKKIDEMPNAILRMIYKSFCSENQEKYDWFLDWLAHMIQRPFEKCTLVPVFIGNEGAGKGILMDDVMEGILKDYYVVVSSSKELTERFNEHLGQKFLTFIDEATWRGNKTEDGIFKRIIGAPTISIEEKFGLKYSINNFSRYLVASNNLEAVCVGVGNRRYCIIETNPKYANNLEFFEPIMEEIKKGKEIKRFYNFLMNRHISSFNPYRLLGNNTDGTTSKVNSTGAVGMFWQDLFYENPKEIFIKEKGLHCNETYEHFLAFCKNIYSYNRSISASTFWVETKKLMPTMPGKKQLRIGSQRTRVVPIDVKDAVLDFSNTLKIKQPEIFEEDEFFIETSDFD